MAKQTEGFSLSERQQNFIESIVKETKHTPGYRKSRVVQEALDILIRRDDKTNIVKFIPVLILECCAIVVFIFGILSIDIFLLQKASLTIPLVLIAVSFLIAIAAGIKILFIKSGVIRSTST